MTTNETQDATDAFIEVLESVTLSLYASNQQTNMHEVGIEVLSVLSKFGWELVNVGTPQERSAIAIGEAIECLARSKSEHVRTGAQSSMAYALQGILLTLIAQQQDSPPADVRTIDLDTGPDSELWGGKGARG